MIDFHCHLDLYPDPQAVAASAQDSRVAVLSVTTTPTAFKGTLALAAGRPMIVSALGFHPELAHQRSHELALFDQLVSTTMFVGEIGLDGSPRFAETRGEQQDAFARVLRSCADVGGRILSIHSRGAARPVLDALIANPESGTPVLHWFTGSVRQAEAAIEHGCWFSVGAPMLTTAKGRDLAAVFPRNRVLTETDGPFTIVDHRPAVPCDISDTLQLLSDLWDIPVSEVEGQVDRNLQMLLTTLPHALLPRGQA